MPWRTDTRPYYVLVSELMLQQTQVDRVVPKFLAFIERFPDVEALAQASLAEVLMLWQGLGYNRRAKFLHQSAQYVCQNYAGIFPQTKQELIRLPGVGPNTAGAILNYAFNIPTVFIETNVRTVYFYHFFTSAESIHDSQITEVLLETLDTENPREFYWALMDYGSWLKKQGVGSIKQSRHYKKQSPLEGSVRQVRGQIVRVLTQGDMNEQSLKDVIKSDERYEKARDGLLNDGLISLKGEKLHLTK